MCQRDQTGQGGRNSHVNTAGNMARVQPRSPLPSPDEARKAWAAAGVQILEEVASTYGGYIVYRDLAERLFDTTGIHTSQNISHWTGKPLGAVLEHCRQNNLPALTALVVHAGDGMVGEGFNEFLRQTGRDEIDDPLQLEWVAAQERLKCYRLYCPHVPADATPTLTREYAATLKAPEPKREKPKPSCPACGMQLPATGQCDYCP